MKRVNFGRIIKTLLVISVAIPFMLREFLDGFSPLSIAVSAFIVGWIFVGFSFYYYGAWSRVNPVLFRIEREPVVKISTITGDTPASFYGEVKYNEEPLISPYTKTRCVYYHFIKEKYDGESWRVVETKSNHIPFYVDDGTGKIHIRFGFIRQPLTAAGDEVGELPDYSNSELDARKAVYQHEYSEKGLVPGFPDRYRVNEYVLESNREVFVHGWTYKQDNKRIAVVSRGVPLIVSMKTKDAYLEDFAVGDSFFYTHNFLLYIGVILLYLAINHFFPISVAFLLVALAGITARMVIQIRNRMVVLRNRIRNAESQIAIEMRKRADLVPQLEEVIKEYRNYERNVFEKLNAIRKMILSAEPGLEKPATKLDKLVKSIENYPRLKASENFQHFADCITRIESSIAYYRGFYNKTILKYNSLIHSVPFNLFAMIFGFKSKGYLK